MNELEKINTVKKLENKIQGRGEVDGFLCLLKNLRTKKDMFIE